MNDIEISRLTECEAVIERGMKTFVEVGNALLEIRDGKLYRETFGTFEDYCRERWGMVGRQAERLMASAEAIENLRPIGRILPTNEYQTRPLTMLEPAQQVQAWQKAIETAPAGKVTAAIVQAAVDEIRKPLSNPVLYSSESVEWNTPADIIERVVAIFGSIDLDPCSNSKVNPNVPAGQHYTKDDNGLSRPWIGKVYMNPPYGLEIIDWVEHLANQYENGSITEAIALVPSRTDTKWFRRLREYPRCFIWGRLKFGGQDNSAPFPSMVVYLGEQVGEFINSFIDIGDIYGTVRI